MRVYVKRTRSVEIIMKEEGKRIQTLIGGNFNAKTREKGGKMSNRIWKEKGWISE